jgi:hypothetical protein
MYIHKAVGSKLIWGRGCLNLKFELLLHFSSSFVCVCSCLPPPLLTTLIHDLIGTWLGPTHLCVFPNEINKNSMLKEVQTWGMFLRKLGLPDKRAEISLCIAGLFEGTIITVWITQTWCWLLSKCTRVCFEKRINEIKWSVWC